MVYISRLVAPSATDVNWISTSKGGKNKCILIDEKSGSVLPNCVGYAWGRFMELASTTPKLSLGNAEVWYDYNDGYPRGKTPKLGAIACWKEGNIWDSKDGGGHLGVVEVINSDGSFKISDSSYNGARFRVQTIGADCKYYNMTFQGFIYNPYVTDEPVPDPSKDVIHVVMQGDTLWQLALRYLGNGSLYTRIMEWNHLTSTTIHIGQHLIVKRNTPTDYYYIVKKGDSLWAIAQKELGDGKRYTDIKIWNQLSSDTIYPDQKLLIKK